MPNNNQSVQLGAQIEKLIQETTEVELQLSKLKEQKNKMCKKVKKMQLILAKFRQDVVATE